MNKQIKKINLNHSFIFFILCNIFTIITLKNNYFIISPLICLFLILSIGVSHGSLDNLKGKKLFKIFGISNFFIFYLSYILISISIIVLWIIIPTFSLLLDTCKLLLSSRYENKKIFSIYIFFRLYFFIKIR